MCSIRSCPLFLVFCCVSVCSHPSFHFPSGSCLFLRMLSAVLKAWLGSVLSVCPFVQWWRVTGWLVHTWLSAMFAGDAWHFLLLVLQLLQLPYDGLARPGFLSGPVCLHDPFLLYLLCHVVLFCILVLCVLPGTLLFFITPHLKEGNSFQAKL